MYFKLINQIPVNKFDFEETASVCTIYLPRIKYKNNKCSSECARTIFLTKIQLKKILRNILKTIIHYYTNS